MEDVNMIKSIKKMLPLLALVAMPSQGQIIGYEYWLDNAYDKRVEVRTSDGNIRQEVDVSALSPGIHRFHLRAEDTEGRWSNPFCKRFLCLGSDYSANNATLCQYSIDGGTWIETAIKEGVVSFEIPANGLLPGMHRIMVRVGDEVGRWSPTMTSNFLCLGSDYSQNKMSRYEYWVDGDKGNRMAGTTFDGTVHIELQTDNLCYGMHHVTLRTQDEAGRWSSPITRYFLKPEPSIEDNMIIAYEYWFNHGATTCVSVDSANPFTAEDIMIEINGVVPNDIDDSYTVDWNTMTAYTPDDVVFGIRYGDASGRWSEARLDTFAYNVPVKLDPVMLKWNDTVNTCNADAGHIYTYFVEAQTGDTLTWTTAGPCKIDFYSEVGVRLARIDSPTMPVEHKMTAEADGRVFALAYSVPTDTLSLCCSRMVPSGITMLESGIDISVCDGLITVNGAEGGSCAVYSVQGYIVYNKKKMANFEKFRVQNGMYIVSLIDAAGNTYRKTLAVY